MRTTCLINTYNYARFVTEAIESALRQTVQFDEILVVDDGSTDGTPDLLKRRYASHDRVRLLLRADNEGQLACLNEGFRVASGDVVFFLDADDQYTERHVERVLRAYAEHPGCDFTFCAAERFGEASGFNRPFGSDRDVGHSAIAALYAQQWVGAVTSTLSIHRRILEQFLPIPLQGDWRTRADDCLVWGSSIAGARKHYLAEPLVRYRVHAHNAYYRRQFDVSYDYLRQLRIQRLFSYLRDRLGLHGELRHLSSMEFRTIPAPTREELGAYAGLVATADLPVGKKLRQLLAMGRHYALARAKQPARPLLAPARV